MVGRGSKEENRSTRAIGVSVSSGTSEQVEAVESVIFATPVGFFIAENVVSAKDVVVGEDTILVPRQTTQREERRKQ